VITVILELKIVQVEFISLSLCLLHIAPGLVYRFVVGGRIGVAMRFIVVVGVHRGNYGVVEVGTESLVLVMAGGDLRHEVEGNGAKEASQNSLRMKSLRRLSLAKKMPGGHRDRGELTGSGIQGGRPGKDVC
jgi:hypothetical protein